MFQRHPNNPTIPRTPGTFYSIFSANPDLLFFNGKYHFYFRGQGDDHHDQMGVAYATPEDFDGVHWEMAPENPIIRAGADPDDFDSAHVLDPGTAVVDGKVFLYYTAWSMKKGAPPGTGLAISEDGTHFEKVPENPVLTSRGAPEVVTYEGQLFLIYSGPSDKWPSGRSIHCCPTNDGIHIDTKSEIPIFGPTGKPDDFDGFAVGTVRIWREDPWHYMTYGGGDRFVDYPCGIGLARSSDLLHWDRYPGNPILPRGEPGAWDEGGLWFATVEKVGATRYLWYEGFGSGMGLETPEAREASRVAREGNYGGFAKTSFSQIGLATHTGDMPDW